MSKENEKNNDFSEKLYEVTMQSLAIESITYIVSSMDSFDADISRIDTVSLLELCANMSRNIYNFLSSAKMVNSNGGKIG